MTLTQACALLCVALPCNADDVKTAYRKQARRHHPDLGGDEEMMKSINQAYELALTWCSPVRGKAPTWAA
jgi:DnaJ-domain-containing protein 1